MKITKLKTALVMIEEISEYAQSTNPKRDWEEAAEAIGAIYRIAHTVNRPSCQKNHPQWGLVLDQRINAGRASRTGKKGA